MPFTTIYHNVRRECMLLTIPGTSFYYTGFER